MKTLSKLSLFAILAAGCLFVPSIAHATTEQDPWANSLQFTDYLSKIQTFATNLQPGDPIIAAPSGSKRAIRRAYQVKATAAATSNLKKAQRAVNDLNTLKDRASRDSDESQANRDAAIEQAFTQANNDLDYKHSVDDENTNYQYAQQQQAAQTTFDASLAQNDTAYNAAVIDANNTYGSSVAAATADRTATVQDCAKGHASLTGKELYKSQKPTRTKKESKKHYEKEVKAYNKKVKAADKKHTKYTKCVSLASSDLSSTLNGTSASDNDGLSGELQAKLDALAASKDAQDAGTSSAFDSLTASIEHNLNLDGLLNDYEYTTNQNLLQTRHDNAIERSARLHTEEGDIIDDSYRASIRAIEDLYTVTDDDLGVDSSQS